MAKFCKNCGSRIDEGAAFCDVCGKKIESVQSAQTQQPAPPQSPQQYAQPGAPQQPPENKNKALIITIIVAASAVLITGIMLILMFVFPGFMNRKDDGSSSQPQATETQTVETKATEADTEAPSTEEPTTEEPTTEEPTTVEPTIDVNNVGKPSQADFSWFTGKTDLSAPSGAKALKNASEVNGTWKMMIDYYGSSTVVNLCNAVVSADSSGASVTVKPYQVNFGSGYQTDSTGSYVLDGSLSGGSLSALGNSGRLTITQFYEINGRQYAYGDFMNPSGETASVGLVRP